MGPVTDRPSQGPSHTAGPDSQALLRELAQVLDPELDEPIFHLGFIESLRVEEGRVIVEVRLPTFWCAANFAYLMAYDIRGRLLKVEGVESVTVRLKDHFASETLETGVNTGRSFADAFPEEAFEDLKSLRALFLRKGFIIRQERLLTCLLDAGLSASEVCSLLIGDIKVEGESCVVALTGGGVRWAGPAEPARRYLERRAEIGMETSPEAPLFTDLGGSPLQPGRLREHLRRAQLVRVSVQANASMCEALLSARKAQMSSSGPVNT